MEAFCSLPYKNQCKKLIKFMQSSAACSSHDVLEMMIEQLSPPINEEKVIPDEIIDCLPWLLDIYVEDDPSLLEDQVASVVLTKFLSAGYYLPLVDNKCPSSIPDYYQDRYLATALKQKLVTNVKPNTSDPIKNTDLSL